MTNIKTLEIWSKTEDVSRAVTEKESVSVSVFYLTGSWGFQEKFWFATSCRKNATLVPIFHVQQDNNTTRELERNEIPRKTRASVCPGSQGVARSAEQSPSHSPEIRAAFGGISSTEFADVRHFCASCVERESSSVSVWRSLPLQDAPPISFKITSLVSMVRGGRSARIF